MGMTTIRTTNYARHLQMDEITKKWAISFYSRKYTSSAYSNTIMCSILSCYFAIGLRLITRPNLTTKKRFLQSVLKRIDAKCYSVASFLTDA